MNSNSFQNAPKPLGFTFGAGAPSTTSSSTPSGTTFGSGMTLQPIIPSNVGGPSQGVQHIPPSVQSVTMKTKYEEMPENYKNELKAIRCNLY
jgi:hypothetical protein